MFWKNLLYFKMHHRIQYLNPHCRCTKQRTWNWILYVLPASTFLRSWIFQIPPVFLKTPPSGAIFFEWGVNKVVILHQMFGSFDQELVSFLARKLQKEYSMSKFTVISKECFRTCNVLPFSCTHLAFYKGKVKDPRYMQNIKGFKNFFINKSANVGFF